MSPDIGAAPPRSKAVTIILVAALAVVLCGVVVYVSLPAPVDIPRVPDMVPRADAEGIILYFDEFKLEDRSVSVTLDFPKGAYRASWFELERGVDSVLWVEYGGQEYACLTKLVIPMRLPPSSKIDRVKVIGHLRKDDPAPEQGASIKGGFQIPDRALKRSTHLRLVVEGVERVSR